MLFYKKIIITLILVIFTYIIWKLLKHRREILSLPIQKEGFQFFSSSDPDSELKGLTDDSSVLIQNMNPKYTKNPLRDYVIKSSYNSAITGNYVNLDMIKYLFKRGCRFMDFEIFYINKKPVVAYSTDKNIDTLDTDNSILLDTVLSSVVSYAFSPPSPNYEDPVFIHLRIKSKDPEVYKAVSNSIDFALKAKLYNKKVTNSTILSDIMGKAVLIMDKTINRDYAKSSTCLPTEPDCYDLSKVVNMESGGDTLYLQRYSELLNQCSIPPIVKDDCDACTNIQNMRLVLPDVNFKNTKNPSMYDFVKNFGCQMVTYRFYTRDAELDNYETFFNDNKSAIVPLAHAIKYINDKKNI